MRHRIGSPISICALVFSLLSQSAWGLPIVTNRIQLLLSRNLVLDKKLREDLARLSEPEEGAHPPLQLPTDVPWDTILGSTIQFAVSIAGGPSPYERNASSSEFAPASTSKLFTASLALEKLGPDFRFETKLNWREVSPGVAAGLTLVGSGDPTWGVVDLVSSREATDDLASQLAAQGIHTVQGPIQLVAADLRWDTYREPVGWDGGTCSYSPPLAFTINRNCLNNRVLNDSKPVARQLLLSSLQARGIRLMSGTAPAGGTEVSVSYLSPPVSRILVPFLKHSINVIGEALLRKVGEKSELARGQDLLEAGLEELREFVARLGMKTAERAGVRALPRYFSSSVTLYDGSGLSHESRVTGDAMIALLRDIGNASYFQYIWDALPIAGVDGTLRERMKGTAAEGLLRAKTGTIKGVYNLVGYVPRMANERILELIPFVILTRDAKNKTAAHLIEDRLGRALAEAVIQTTPVMSTPAVR